MSETGAIKFKCEHVAIAPAEFSGFVQLNMYRQKLRALGLIGAAANGIGFGNLSMRDGETNAFYITGSGTGAGIELGLSDYARVIEYDLKKNWLRCEGAVASSESLTHAALYEAAAGVRAVIHCHHLTLWSKLIGTVPTTSATAEYGTPEMAREVQRLFASNDVRTTKLFVMGGHREGIVTLGKDIEEAFTVLDRAVAQL